MNTSPSSIDMARTRALLDRMDQSWHSSCGVEGCTHRQRAQRTHKAEVAPLPRRRHRRVTNARAA